MATLTWVHISDLHWREAQAYDSNVVLQALLADLAQRIGIASELERIDFIFVTGDISFASQPYEYTLARRFFGALVRTTGVPKRSLFVVPGNHDVDRAAISEDAGRIISSLTSRQEVNALLGNEARRATVMERFHRYRQFVNDYLGRHLPFDGTRYFYAKRRRVNAKTIGILGLNSAWASSSDADRLCLLLGEPQVRAAVDRTRAADIRIALLHHPFEWLRDFDHEACEALLLKNCAFVLHGHLHRTGVMHLQGPGRRAMVMEAGACYESLHHRHTYNLVHLDFNSGRGMVYLRQYSLADGGFWAADPLTYQHAPGQYSFDLPPDWIEPPSLPSGPEEPAAGLPVGQTVLGPGPRAKRRGARTTEAPAVEAELRDARAAPGPAAPPARPVAPRRALPAWIPRKIIPEIVRAIAATDRSTHVFYITGQGGGGKTVLLRQIGLALGSRDGIAPHLNWSGILDLYHSDVNTSSGLELRLSHILGADGPFQPYHDEGRAYDARQEAGLPGVELAAERARMSELFADCFNTLTRDRRAVIALDTTERIEHEVDAVQRLCRMESESTTVKAWLLDQLPRWGNCVVLLVGRPEAEACLDRALAAALANKPRVHYRANTLGGFDEEEALAYFAQKEPELPALGLLDAELRHRLWEVTGGSPIRLDLALEAVRQGLGIARLREAVAAPSTEAAGQALDRLFVAHLLRGEQDEAARTVLYHLAVARQGLDARLLHHLVSLWSPQQCQDRLSAIGTRPYVRQRPADGRLFLHDEMHQLCDQLLLDAADVQQLSRRIVEWYDRQIQYSPDKSRTQDLQVDSLLYRLRADPRQGYQWYARLSEYAIRAAEVSFDLRLRNEVMAFLSSQSPLDQQFVSDAPGLAEEFDCDCAAQWVKRLSVRGENERALRVAREVSAERTGFLCLRDPRFRLARADLRVCQAQALIYSGLTGAGIELLRRAIADLEAGQGAEPLVPREAQACPAWRGNLVLGKARNNLGYAHWMEGHYEAALQAFRSALCYFRASDLGEELANTSDNMGRVYALCRDPTRAAALVEEGLALRRGLGRDYRIALSLNSRAIVHLEFGAYHYAQHLSEEALNTFEKLGTPRGIGLARLTLGRALRGLGGLWLLDLYSGPECERHLRDGAESLEQAARIFEQLVDQPVRWVEAVNELGCLYRDWARLAVATSPSSPLGATLSTKAIQQLVRCAELAEKHRFVVSYVDACEDLAETYLLLRDHQNADDWLDRAERSIPEGYRFGEGERAAQIGVEERIEALWLQLGKIELLRGKLAFDEGTGDGVRTVSREVLEAAAQHYALAAAYFERYSKRAAGLQSTLRQMYDHFKGCRRDDLSYLRDDVLPKVAERYGIDLSRLSRFFDDTLGLAI